jgi:hypothetical protein
MPVAIFEHHSIKEGTAGCVLLEDQSFTCLWPSLKPIAYVQERALDALLTPMHGVLLPALMVAAMNCVATLKASHTTAGNDHGFGILTMNSVTTALMVSHDTASNGSVQYSNHELCHCTEGIISHSLRRS